MTITFYAPEQPSASPAFTSFNGCPKEMQVESAKIALAWQMKK